MTAPRRHRPSVTRNNHLSLSKRLGIPLLRVRWILQTALLQSMDEVLESAARMFVTLKLIKAGAGRLQKHDVSRMSRLRSETDSIFERAGALDCNSAFDLLLNFVGGCADQRSEEHTSEL